MTRHGSIGGRLTGDAYAMLANQHRPTDPARVAAEVKRLHAEQHLTAIDISTALRIDHAQVINILASPTTQDLRQ
jgi:hypothetical protein